MSCLCEDKTHFWGLKSEKYGWQMYEGKSVQINQIGIGGFLMNYQHSRFWFALLAADFVYKASQSHPATDFWGFLLRSEWLQLQMPLSSDPVSTADQNCPALLFWRYNVAWHVKILCNSGAVVLSLQLKHILLGGGGNQPKFTSALMPWEWQRLLVFQMGV